MKEILLNSSPFFPLSYAMFFLLLYCAVFFEDYCCTVTVVKVCAGQANLLEVVHKYKYI